MNLKTRISMAKYIFEIMRDEGNNMSDCAFNDLVNDGIHLLSMNLSGAELLDKLGEN
jgi:hypothetical protein